MTKREPALQNIPLRTETGRAVREAFAPKPGDVFVEADYAGLEARIAASMPPCTVCGATNLFCDCCFGSA